ncbi:TonB-dependent receptor domain-containing protein [Planctobacterium marinum]|uniref:TonB-dependent receptor domain-containing protein n=1 Tax=Planctobacterium marinum TaxID=1631968 RepID=UPI001E28332F|nr:TonB-dependent receptor [Planctobacterium marinum]MCC2608214.1 TonB-dependent receptor [Planctobacterium marinum]
MNKLVLAGSICLAGVSSFAAAAEEETKSTDFEKITVVGVATNSIITAEEVETYQANDLADVFRATPSVSVGGSVGVAQKIYIRGLEDSLLNVTVDGAQQTSTLFHHIGRVNIDPDLLQQVDVQAGAGEATSGPGAIGGSIRFKTKDANDLLGADQQFGGKLKWSEFTNDGRRVSGSLYGKLSDSWGLLGYYSDVERNNFEDGDGNEVLGTAAEQDMAFVKLSGNITDRQYLSVSYEKRDEEGQFSARPNWEVPEGAPLYPSQAERETVVANYSYAHSELVNLEVTAYQTESAFRGGRFDWLATIDTFGLDIRNTSEVGNHIFIYGVDYRDDSVESGYAIPQAEENHAEEGSVTGWYFQGYTDVTDALRLSYGARYDQYEYDQKILLDDYYGTPITEAPAQQDDNELSINAGLSYALTDKWTFGLGYAEAARGKEIGDGFTIDGYLYDGSEEPVTGSNLVPETVANIEASLQYSDNNLNARIAVYDSQLDDVIFNRLYGDALFENIGTIETQGFEFDVAYRWGEFDFFVGFSSNDSELDPRADLYTTEYSNIAINGYEFNGLGNSRGDTWVLGLDYTPHADVQIGFNVTRVNSITFDTLHQDHDLGWVDSLYALTKPSYTTVDLYGEWQATADLSFNLAVTNAFDKLYRDQSSVGDFSAVPGYELVVGPYEAGRDIRLTVAYTF